MLCHCTTDKFYWKLASLFNFSISNLFSTRFPFYLFLPNKLVVPGLWPGDIWMSTWESTLVKNPTHVTSVRQRLRRKSNWRFTCRCTRVRKNTSATSAERSSSRRRGWTGMSWPTQRRNPMPVTCVRNHLCSGVSWRNICRSIRVRRTTFVMCAIRNLGWRNSWALTLWDITAKGGTNAKYVIKCFSFRKLLSFINGVYIRLDERKNPDVILFVRGLHKLKLIKSKLPGFKNLIWQPSCGKQSINNVCCWLYP